MTQRVSVNIEECCVELYVKGGLLQKDIAKKLKISRNSVQHILDHNNVVKKSVSDLRRKYKIDESVFSIRYTSPSSVRIADVLYSDSVIYLERKYIKYWAFLFHPNQLVLP